MADTGIDDATSDAALRDEVRTHYARAATAVKPGSRTNLLADESCCATSCCGDSTAPGFGSGLYDLSDTVALPVGAVEASMGCGNPVEVAELHEGERVLDLGSGGGIDVLLSARRVGPSGFAYGVDMTDEMLARAGFVETTVEFTHEVADGMHGAIVRASKPAVGSVDR
ncbi:MAG: methyltransferase domain-containing protein [Acidipropionibacterium acidipropionici]|uniref:Methyltransferase n=1 Tax=Acidipropionibacterium acidipropionici (strain ATCC 4875 / DSM 20272 / JCM 6432 / NBRC 12425 / NCIMB 8070 / 4) TaxID=1171373 RepID=K7S658_ACIA4|nr:methyltransferase domain-containing protein [Acidipropionibacterium acidipropionici]AFV90127.1 Putative methyltransferase [Acidipropionibacterium acidipropionici ATCC 4875]ALN15588.1 hypothetical protein ASQ49_10260 [Acidipropionibacterium acidipropionici]MDN6557312.1 hypothetical protein [Acidipropionibacterium acidipropionici]